MQFIIETIGGAIITYQLRPTRQRGANRAISLNDKPHVRSQLMRLNPLLRERRGVVDLLRRKVTFTKNVPTRIDMLHRSADSWCALTIADVNRRVVLEPNLVLHCCTAASIHRVAPPIARKHTARREAGTDRR